MSYGKWRILEAAVEQKVLFKNYNSYMEYIINNKVVVINEQLNLDGSFIATIRKHYNKNYFLNQQESSCYITGEYEGMLIFTKSLEMGSEVLCMVDDEIISTEIVKVVSRNENPDWFDNTKIENLREIMEEEYQYSGMFELDDDNVYLFLRKTPEYGHEFLSECPMCHQVSKFNLTYEELNKAILYQNGHIKDKIQDILPGLNSVEREFIKTGYCVECQQLLFGSKIGSKRISYKS